MKDIRLERIAAAVRQGSRLADIGTDHAHLPIMLVRKGVCPSAIACDLREGPLENARRSVSAAGLSDRIECRLGDGLSPLSAGEADDIVIAGMGGETIAAIIEPCTWVRQSQIRLLLQPMTHAERLRRYLLTNGFSILKETVVEDTPHLYVFMEVAYTAAPPVEDEAYWYRGALAGESGRRYLQLQTARLQKERDMLARAGRREEAKKLEKLIERLEEELP